MKVANDTLLNLVSVAANQTSETVDVRNIYMFAIQLLWTGTASGTVTVQKSVDGTTWFTEATQAMGGAPGSALIEKTVIPYAYMRVISTAGGAGLLTAKYFGKGS